MWLVLIVSHSFCYGSAAACKLYCWCAFFEFQECYLKCDEVYLLLYIGLCGFCVETDLLWTAANMLLLAYRDTVKQA